MNSSIQGGSAGETFGKFLLIGIISQFVIISIVVFIISIIGLLASRSVGPDKQMTAIMWGVAGILIGGLVFWYSTAAFKWGTCLWCDND